MAHPLAFPAIHASHSGIWLRDNQGETQRLGRGEAVALAADTPVILLNAPLIGQRIGYADISGLDLLELFAFVHPARFMVPTPAGFLRALNLSNPFVSSAVETPQQSRNGLSTSLEANGDVGVSDPDVPALLHAAAETLLTTLQSPDWAEREGAWDVAQALNRQRWAWSGEVIRRLPKPERAEKWLFSRLSEWEEEAPRPAPGTVTLDEEMVIDQLDALTGQGAEKREGQVAYAKSAARVFSPRERRDAPNMLLAEAGTGIGKTLGYLAPASLWAAEADGAVWVSTYTKALQRQLRQETHRIYPDAKVLKHKVVVRKGRENYLCLLNLEDALQGGFSGRPAIFAQLVARWAAYTRDGDMIGGDMPGWLPTLFRRKGTTALTDRRGECIYAGCAHYRKCFIEKASRASAQADIVIANHALVMVNAVRGREEQNHASRIIFDEGHHLFDAADSMFSAALTGQEAIEIRRWVIGPEGNSRGRRRGLAARLADVASYDSEGGAAIEAARMAASLLPGEGWLQRLIEGVPQGEIEALFAAIRALVYARDESGSQDAGYGLETECAELSGELLEAAAKAASAIDRLLKPLITLGKRLEALLVDGPDWMDGPARARIEGALGSLGWRTDSLTAWLSMLSALGGPADSDFIDWLAVDRFEGREYDIGLHRRWIDPTRPLAKTVLEPAHGVMVTSATLKSGDDWPQAIARSGAAHLPGEAMQFSAKSPFDYGRQAEILIVTDIKRGDIAALANGYARLVEASEGGALGLFTAIRRLRAVHGRIADRLAEHGLPLYAQHVDPIDTGTLVDIFRDDPRATLLGTDALRDGVDVPGHSLRLVVMEGVPWPKPSIVHKARKLANGGSSYDDQIIKARLAQAFGRLIRSKQDHGHFVVLSAAFPSRLLSAFPEGTTVRRVTLAEAVLAVQSQKHESSHQPHQDQTAL
ncbi:MAG: ATP-dependent DNA helicase [Pseudomonadota bacterium]